MPSQISHPRINGHRPLLSIVLPAYNEEEVLSQTYQRFVSALPALDQFGLDHELIFVNDGSHDRATGHSFRPTHDGAYKHAPEYGHPEIRRDEYKNIYREAYVRGYQKGYGR